MLLPVTLVWAAIAFTTRVVGDANYDQAKDVRPFDLDEDGDIDFLAVSDVKNDVSWFRNNGSQSFTEITIDASFTDPYSIIGANLDSTGGLDVAACSADFGDRLKWYSNDGSESFTAHDVGAMADCTVVFAGDMDGDGDTDLVTGEYSEGDLDWWENDGAGSFTRIAIDSALGAVWDVYVIDIDDDTDLDVLVADFGAYDVLLFTSNGANNPTFTKSTIDANLDQTHSVFANDLDDDGDIDVLATGRLADDVIWYSNNGSESFTKNTVDANLDGASDITTGDLDGDGDKDLAVAGQFANDVVWYDNNGSESFTKTNIDIDFEAAYKTVIYDVDRDGDNDIVATGNNNNTDNVTWFENTGTPAPTLSTVSPTDNATNVSLTANLVLTFSQTIRAGTGSLVIKKTSDDSIVETITTSGALVSISTTQATVNPSVTLAESTSYYVTVGANAFKNTSGGHYAGITTGTVWNFTTTELTPPSVTTLSPADNASSVSKTANLVITFNETARAGTGTLTLKKTSDDSTVETITVSGALLSGNGTTQLTLNPSTTLAELTSYYAVWSGNAFKDTAGNHVAAVTSSTAWNFTTTDTVAPGISTLSPADNAVDVSATSPLIITFDEAVQGGTGSILIKKSSDDTTVETIAASGALVAGSGSATITIDPSVTLQDETAYYILVQANAFRDIHRNHFAGITAAATWNIVTGVTTAASLEGGRHAGAFRQRAGIDGSDSSGDGGGSGGGGSAPRSVPADASSVFVPNYAPLAAQLLEARNRAIAGTPLLLPDQRKIPAIREALVARFQQQIAAMEQHEKEAQAAEAAFQSQSAMATSEERRLARAQELVRLSSEDLRASAPVNIAARRGLLLGVIGTQEVVFRDVPVNAWYAPYVAILIEENVAQGYKDEEGNPTGEFGVGQPVTRAEALKMALEAAGKKPTGEPPRNLSAQGTWASSYVGEAEHLGLSVFGPDVDVHASASRGELVQTLLEVTGILIGKTPTDFTDVPATHPYSAAIATAAFYGFTQGDTAADGSPLQTFRPDDPINRAEVAKIIAVLREIRN